MSQGVKRHTDGSPSPADSPEKKMRMEDSLLKFELMKQAADENRRRVRDNYLKEHALAQASGANSPAAKTSKSPAVSKTKASLSSASKPSRKTPSKSAPTKSPSTKKTDASSRPKPSSKKSVKTTDSTQVDMKKTPSSPVSGASPVIALTHVSSADDEKVAAAEVLDSQNEEHGALYPSIAISDAFNAIGHLLAAFVAFENGQEVAGMGFLSVWLAAIVGVLRFGVNEKLFQQANSDLSNLAGFVGYPLIGMSYAASHFKNLNINVILVGFLLVAWEALTRSFLEKNKDAAKLATNIVFFVGPIAAVCQETEDYPTMAALLAFILAGIVITPHHDNCILGIRCVNLFHYIIGATALWFAFGLGQRS